MTQEHWDRVVAAFARLRALPADERERALARMEPEVGDRVRPLLAADDERRNDPSLDFLESPLAGPEWADDPAVLAPGSMLDRYRVLGRLGQGGMGRVYLAEPASGAAAGRVAVKVPSGDLSDPKALRRFELERQLLEDIRHPHVARCLGGGTLAHGRPYVVMEYVDGVPIDVHCEQAQLDVRERVRLMVKVCGGLQAVHEQLVVHRDVKPSNILVDGDGEPRLVDFGIAKLLDGRPERGERDTATINVRLTPAYASPEHLLGQPVTAASDVYSLGVVLYSLLTDRMPRRLSGAASRQEIESGFREDPVAPSAWARRRWRDARRPDRRFLAALDRVVLKALSVHPASRYPTARDLADDLERAQSGRPVAAARAPRWRRARSWARRHPVAAALLAACAGWALIVGVAFQVNGWRVREQAAQARYFTQRAAEIEATHRMLAFLPRREVAVDSRHLLLRHTEELRDELRSARGLARPAAHFALGRSLLALERLDEARNELQAAWDAGLRTPDVALALGEAHGRLYRQALDELRRVEGERPDAARRRRLAAALRVPALEYLRLARGAGAARADYVAGLIAYFEDRLDRAEALAEAASTRSPWLLEARVLSADVLLRRSELAAERGAAEELADQLAAAREAYRDVLALAPSTPAAASGECETWLRELAETKSHLPLDPRVLDEAVAACRAGIALDPGAVRTHFQLASLALMAVLNSEVFGLPGREGQVELALAEAREAAALDQSDPIALHVLGTALREKARLVARDGGDPEALFAEADRTLAAAARTPPPHLETQAEWATTALDEATWLLGNGRSAESVLERAVARFQTALEMNPGSGREHGNLGTALLSLAFEARGAPGTREHLARAADHLRAAAELDSSSLFWFNNLGVVHLVGAEVALLEGEDPEPYLRRAEELYLDLFAREPAYNRSPYHLALVHSKRAEARVQAGRDPADELRQARHWARRAEEAGFDRLDLPLEQARIEWLAARHRAARGLPAEDALRAAELHLARAAELGGAGSGEVALVHAEDAWLRAMAAPPGSPGWTAGMEDAGRWLAEALRRDPRLAAAHLLESERLRRLCEADGAADCSAAGAEPARRAEEILPGVRHHLWRWR